MKKINILQLVTLFFATSVNASIGDSIESLFSPSSELDPRWVNNSKTKQIDVNNELYDDFLKKYTQVSAEQNFINYKAVSIEDKGKLNNYINYLSGINPLFLTKNQQLSYWMNLYNSLTIKLILDKYPIASIRDLGGFFSVGPWNEKLIKINNIELTLSNIENNILRPIWNDNRVHYGLNCASLGCPDIINKSFKYNSVQSELSLLENRFINQTKGVRIDGDDVYLSSIYNWYSSDFNPDIVFYLNSHIKSNKKIKTTSNIKYIYNWKLNEKTKPILII